MKINMPVTSNEVQFSDSEFMLTKTNMKGVITFANQDFIKVSGFTEEELVGSSHNVVRHPDMPVEAFEDMWRDLKAGKPWTGMVKNRTKNGDFYWVEANAAPIFENGQVSGFLSARKKPSRQQVAAADAAYRLFKEGKAAGLKIVHGKVVRDNFVTKLTNKLQNLNISQRLFGMSGIAVTIATGLVLFGLNNLANVNASFKTVYEDRMVPVGDLDKIVNLRDANRLAIRTALSDAAPVVTKEKTTEVTKMVIEAPSLANAIATIEKNKAEIDKLWKAYMATYLTPEEKVLAAKYEVSTAKFREVVLLPALAALKANDWDATMKVIDEEGPAVAEVTADAEALHKLQFDVATEEYATAVKRLETARYVSFGALAAAIALLVWLGVVVIRSITKPLNKAIEVFGNIASGKLDTGIETQGDNELSKVLNQLRITQTGLNVSINAQQEEAENVKIAAVKYENQLAAISKSSGVIEFEMDGKIIAVNDIFLNAMGYSREEMLTMQHSGIVMPDYKITDAYKQCWAKLNKGEAVTGEFRRLGKGGKEVWVQASYNPILDAAGKPYKIVAYANDITAQKLKNADFEGQMNAISKSQGVIELGLDGTILKVNEVYAQMLGYSADELLGKNVSIVLDPTFAKSSAYSTLWSKLVAGGTDAGQYKRLAKTGKEVWIQASYNPIYDINGKVKKIVNYTIDITKEKTQAADFAGQIEAISEIQGVIEFDLTGKIMAVNDNFGHVTGYSEKEIVGNHHSMFVEPAYKTSHEYKAFWENLAKGEPQLGQYKRVGKGGKEIWLQASYNPILDLNGKPFKVVKYATDISEQHRTTAALETAVEETQGVIEGAKAGDLTSRVSLDGKTGAIASLCDGVNALMDKMTEIIVQVREAGETINTAAGEISSGNTDLSVRTEQQASSLEQTASSMEELASTVKQNSENAKQANQLAATASGVAVKGGEVVGQVVDTMSAINSSAKKIEDIISVIDGIAFQTNILALNAAVEAARAGEQGRGFAVVAGEVRNLAQRSASAAKEIKELITDSVSKTAQGTLQVENAGKTMQEIVSSVQRVTDIMGEITAASVEQSAGIDLVNNAITSMDEATQQNAALVEEAAAAAESLVEQSTSLMDTVNEFRISGGNQNAAHKNIPNRRVTPNPMRAEARSASKPETKATAKPAAKSPAKAISKTGTDDGEWAEF